MALPTPYLFIGMAGIAEEVLQEVHGEAGLEAWKKEYIISNMTYFNVLREIFNQHLTEDPRLQFYGEMNVDLTTGKVRVRRLISVGEFNEEKKEGMVLQ